MKHFTLKSIVAGVLLLLLSGPLLAQQRAIVGKVTSSEDGAAVPGVNILVKGTTVGTTTDVDGKYRISVPNSEAILVFSYVGYVTAERPVGTASTLDVVLEVDAKTLSEVVVVGYGTQERAKVTGAISSVKSEELIALPVPNIGAALQGRAAGVTVTNNGAPGEGPIVRIRGIGSISFASNPLYVIDGFPTGDLNSFDTRDIESVEVLKDASSAAIYGSRAANGVIIITTRKGKAGGKLRVNLDTYAGVQSAWRFLDLLNRDEYIRYGTALRQNAGQAPPARFANLNQPLYVGTTQTYAQTDTDWQKEMFRQASIQQHHISLSGGSDKSTFYASGGFFDQKGIMLGTGYKRGNFRINSEHKIGSRFSFGQNLMIAYDDRMNEQNPGGRTILQNIIRMTPYMPVEDPTRPGGYRGPDGSDATDPQNPVRAALQDRSNQQRLKFLANAYLDFKITDWLKYRFTAGVDYVSARTYNFLPIYNESFNARTPAVVNDNRDLFFSPIYTNQLSFDKTFGQHTINAIVVGERQSGRFIGLNAQGNLASNDVRELSGVTNPNATGSRSENLLLSFLGRVNYEYAGKYLLSASVRRDGSSRFAPGRKWANFPSVSVGWRLSEEEFLKKVDAISELKIRASYGTMGFSGVGDYAWQAAIQQNTAAIIGGSTQPGAFFNSLANTELQWEITRMTNIGFDLGLLDNRFTLSFEAYNRNTDGLILQQPIPSSIGFSNPPTVNIGGIRNWGYEFQAGYNQTFGDLKINASGNLSIFRNEVTALATANSALFAGSNADFGGFDITRTVVGLPIQSFFGWRVGGIIQNQEELTRLNSLDGNAATAYQPGAAPGDIRFEDINGDGVVNADDRVDLGSFLPKFTYGFNLGATWKGFDFTMFIQGVQGNKVYNGTKVLEQGMLRLFNSGTAVLNAWTPQNTNTDVPRAVDGDPNRNSRTSDRFIEDGSFLRIKNLSIGYNLPTSFLSSLTKNTVQTARVYFATQNLLTITRYTGYDPEIGSRFGNNLTNGIDYGQFPAARTLMLGLQVGF